MSKAENNHQEKELNKEELNALAKEMNKRIKKIQKVQSKKKGLRRWKINPYILGATIFFGFILLIGLFNPVQQNNNLSFSDLVTGLNNNEYSKITIQNDGSIKAKENEYYVLNEDLDLDQIDIEESFVNTASIRDESLKSADLEKIVDLLQPSDLLSRIRAFFGTGVEGVSDIVIGENYIVVLGQEDDYIVENTSKQELEDSLRNNGQNLSDLGINIVNLRTSSEDVLATNLVKRIEDDQVVEIIQLDGQVLAKINPNLIKEYDVDWTPAISTFTDTLTNLGFDLSSQDETFEVVTVNVAAGITLDTVLTVLTIGGFIFLAFVIFRSAQSSGMGIMQFGQSKAKMFFGKKTDVSFKDVAGIDEAKEELNEIVEFLRYPNKFKKLGARIPKGVLMFGPPGTGKTLLARAIAGEAGVPFFHTSGSEFEEMLVGAGASRVRDLFSKAKKAAPALIFIDEIDAIARKRGTRIQSGTTEQTLNQILVEMDGFETNTNVIVIAATNRPDVLDRAILRPGRFDRQVRIEAPDKDGRMDILKIHSKNKPLSKDIDLEKIAKRTIGFTGADLENILNEAAIIAAKANQKEINTSDIDEAVSKVVLGPAKKSRKRTDDELKLVAYHEAGHAIVAKLTDGAIPVDKISIVSRGSSGGVTMFIPDKDENIISVKRLLADVRVSLGGRAAEEVALNDISTGASNDIEKATQTARNMIKKYGMSKSLGLVKYGQSQDSEYLGYHYGDDQDYSEDTAKLIDVEVRTIVQNAYQEALKILKENKAILDKLANLLIEKEVLEKEEFEKIFDEKSE